MGDLDGVTESTGNKEKVSKWKLYRSQIKRLKENSKPDISTKKIEGVLLDRGSGIDITLSTEESVLDLKSPSHGKKKEKQGTVGTTDIYYPPSQEKSSKWSALRNTMHFIRAARPRVRSHSFPTSASQVDSLPSSFSHLYKGNKAISQPFQLGEATQEEIYEIIGEEVNLYLSGVNRRLSLRQTASLQDHYEYTGGSGT